MSGAFGVGWEVPKGTGPCCQISFSPVPMVTGRQILPVFCRSKVAATWYERSLPAAMLSMAQA